MKSPDEHYYFSRPKIVNYDLIRERPGRVYNGMWRVPLAVRSLARERSYKSLLVDHNTDIFHYYENRQCLGTWGDVEPHVDSNDSRLSCGLTLVNDSGAKLAVVDPFYNEIIKEYQKQVERSVLSWEELIKLQRGGRYVFRTWDLPVGSLYVMDSSIIHGLITKEPSALYAFTVCDFEPDDQLDWNRLATNLKDRTRDGLEYQVEKITTKWSEFLGDLSASMV